MVVHVVSVLVTYGRACCKCLIDMVVHVVSVLVTYGRACCKCLIDMVVHVVSVLVTYGRACCMCLIDMVVHVVSVLVILLKILIYSLRLTLATFNFNLPSSPLPFHPLSYPPLLPSLSILLSLCEFLPSFLNPHSLSHCPDYRENHTNQLL